MTIDIDLEKLHKVSLELKGKSPHEDTDSLSPFSAVNRFSNHYSNEGQCLINSS